MAAFIAVYEGKTITEARLIRSPPTNTSCVGSSRSSPPGPRRTTDAGTPVGASRSSGVASTRNKPLVTRRYLPDEEAQLRALRVLAFSMNTAKRAALPSGQKTLSREEINESSANSSLP